MNAATQQASPYTMIATPGPAQPELVTVSAILFTPEEGERVALGCQLRVNVSL